MAALWTLLGEAAKGKGKQTSISASDIRASLEADPGTAAQPFMTPAGWTPDVGDPVRLRPGQGGSQYGEPTFKAGELATVAPFNPYAEDKLSIKVTRLSDGMELPWTWESFKPGDLVHGFDGWLPLQAALALGASDDIAVVLAEAAPDATGADGRTPLHVAAAAARSVELLKRLLAVSPAFAMARDAEGKTAFQLLPLSAPEDAVNLLIEACGPRPLWSDQLHPATAAPLAAEVQAALDADPGLASRPFLTPEGWAPIVGSVVRLKAGEQMSVQLATVRQVRTCEIIDGNQYISLSRQPCNTELAATYQTEDLVHGFDGWLPLQAAIMLGLDDAAIVLLEATSDVVSADGRTPLHLAAMAAGGRSAGLVKRLLEVSPAWATSRDVNGCFPFQLLPWDPTYPVASEDAAALLFEALGDAAPDAVGTTGCTPLHLAAGLGCSAKLLQQMLTVCPTWASSRDANGYYPLQLLPSSASEAAAATLSRAGPVASGRDPLWQLFLRGAGLTGAETELPPAEAVRAVLEADRRAATRTFAVPAGFMPSQGLLVKLKPGVADSSELRANELATILHFSDMDGEAHLQRRRDGARIIFSSCQTGPRTDCCTSYSNDFTHCFDEWLPLQAAEALDASDAAMVIREYCS
mmetsp:Transcript_16795/g.46245  ORF Transcript_16795/g.46245 Transcript_16795/m.46245 type:complete len:638 (-) Transcript_16795:71-1984(-)